MKYKMGLIFICLVICLLGIASVCANDVNETVVASEDQNDVVSINIIDDISSLDIIETNVVSDYDNSSVMSMINYNNENILSNSEVEIISESSNNNQIIDGKGTTVKEGMRISGHNVTLKNYCFTCYNQEYGAVSWLGDNGKIINCTFSDCESGYGSTMTITGKNCTIINCTFSSNLIGIYGAGGSISWEGMNGKIINSKFVNNTCFNEAGVIFGKSGSCDIINCTFSENIASKRGGVIFLNKATEWHIINSRFLNNVAYQQGGAIYSYGGTLNVNNCEFIENRAGTNGGAIYANGNILINNSIFYKNYAKNNSAIYGSEGNIANSIFLNNSVESDDNFILSSANLEYNWFGNTFKDYKVIPSVTGTLKNWLFLNATHERLMLVGEKMHVPFVFLVWDGTSVFDYDSSKVFPVELNLSSTNGEINKLVSVVGEDILYDATSVGIGCITAKFFDRELTINLNCKNPTEIRVGEPVTIYVDQFMNFIGDEFYAELIPSEAGTLVYSVDDENILTVNNTGFKGLNQGIANIIIEFKETDIYAPANISIPISVVKYDSEIYANDVIAIDYGESKVIDATLIPNSENLIYSSSNVNVATVDNYGIISTVGSGTASINVKFDGNRKYKSSSKNIILTVNKIDSIIYVIKDIEFMYNGSDSTDIVVDGATGVNAYVENHPEANVIIENNLITVSGLDVGNYTLIVTTIPDNNHNCVSDYASITVTKSDSSITIPEIVFDYGSSASVKPVICGATGVTDVKVINHPEANIIVKNNEISVSDLGIGEYTLSATTIPDNNHNSIINSTKITVKKPDSSISFSNDLVFDYGGSDSTKVSFYGATGVTDVKVINHPEANIYVEGNKITVSGLDAGRYTLTATTIPDTAYNAVISSAEITVNKVDSSIKFTEDPVFDYGASSFDSIDVNGIIDFKVSVVEYPEADIQVEDNTISLFDLNVGNYVFSITTIPDKNHNAVRLKVPFKVKKISSIIAVKKTTGYTASSTLKAIVKDPYGSSIDEGRVKFEIDGKSYKVNVKKGVAKLNLRLAKAKTYSYKATFLSDNFYSKTASSKIVVKQSQAKVSTNKITVISGEYFTLKAIVKNSANKKLDEGSIKFSINGKTYKVNVKNGVATKRLKLSAVKTYAYKATFSSKYYKTKVSTSKVIVKKQPVYTIKIGKYSVKISYKDYKKFKNLNGFEYLVKTYYTGKTVSYKVYKDVKQVHTKKKLYSYGTYTTYYKNNPDAMVAPYGYKFAGREFKTVNGIEKVYMVYKKTTYKKVLVKTPQTKVYIMVAADSDGASARVYYKVSEYTDRYGSFETKEYTGPYKKIF